MDKSRRRLLVKPPFDAATLAKDLRARVARLPTSTTAVVRNMRRGFSREIAVAPPKTVLQLAFLLLKEDNFVLRFVAYEIVSHHKAAFASLTTADLLKLGRGLDSWYSVDCFALYLSGPMWAEGRIADSTIAAWAGSKDRWWRRAALVSTVALSRRGDERDVRKVVKTCSALRTDRDDMVVKALSWALRELAKKNPAEAREFIARHHPLLAARVIREVENKLTTGLKTPRRRT
jgi:3-methyladenine DNA glycosylase AlkD